MKILYAAYRHDPLDPDAASGADYNFCRALRERQHEVEVVGPVEGPANAWERALRRSYQRMTGKRYAKFPHSLCRKASAGLNKAEAAADADVVFTLFQPSLVSYRGATPCVFRLDTSFKGYQEGYEEYGDLAMKLSVWQETRAFARCARLITHSRWAAEGLRRDYGVEAERIHCFPNPAGLPEESVPQEEPQPRGLEEPLRILTVGRDFHRKGIDLAQETVHRLNAAGMAAHLTVCGLAGQDDASTRFVGPFRKSKPAELAEYVALYRRSHLLLHPARFDPSPIVTAEAAAFGLPVVTRDVGGIATSVDHGRSGLVLPATAGAEEFAAAIIELVGNPDLYGRLCQGARRRYETELNWKVAGQRVEAVLTEAAEENRETADG